nr:MAG TPA: hypothetical protein [Caudoviricetes sp.]
MAIKPILFNTEMVQAILDGRKTCTRRLVRFLPGENPQWTGYIRDGLMLYNGRNEHCITKAPHQPGDILYVRETFIQIAAHTFWYKADDNSWMPEGLHWKPSIHMPKKAARIWLKVTNVRVERLQEITETQTEEEGFLFTPPCLHRTGENYCDIDGPCGSKIKYCDMSAGELFGKVLWDSTIKKSDLDRYGWDANPWVWVIEFERCEPQEV